MLRRAVAWGIILLALWGASACTNAPPLRTDPTDIVGDDDAAVVNADATNDGSEAEPEAPPLVIDALTFTGDDDTFLETIAAAKQMRNTPIIHRFVQFDDGMGTHWQGEALFGVGNQRTYMQKVQSGGGSGLLIEAAADADITSALASITPKDPSVAGSPPIFPEIQFVRARESSDGNWSFDVTLAYPDSGWDDYADGWHVETPDGEILGTRILLHPHVNEQPFTRSLGGVNIPDGITTVFVRGHALVNGYGLEPLAIPLDESTATELFEVMKYE